MGKLLKIIAEKGGRHGDITVSLVDSLNRNDVLSGSNLGAVQSIKWSAKVGELSRCTLETIMTPAELEHALKDVELNVKMRPYRNNWLSKLEFWWYTHFTAEGRKINKVYKQVRR